MVKHSFDKQLKMLKIDTMVSSDILNISKATKDSAQSIVDLSKDIPGDSKIVAPKIKVVKTSGAKWFDMRAPTMTPELEQELLLLRARNALDPKHFYKKQDKRSAPIPKFFQIGTVVDGAHEFYSNRATNKDKKKSLVEELLSDQERQRYLKKKFLQIQDKKASGGKKWYNAKKSRK